MCAFQINNLGIMHFRKFIVAFWYICMFIFLPLNFVQEKIPNLNNLFPPVDMSDNSSKLNIWWLQPKDSH